MDMEFTSSYSILTNPFSLEKTLSSLCLIKESSDLLSNPEALDNEVNMADNHPRISDIILNAWTWSVELSYEGTVKAHCVLVDGWAENTF